ncbi:MAG: type II toxin-antitoxin system HicA family toxin [bacterium]|nr:type II toxin-antitoxin system HicA family toxin [bacterium]
MNRGAQREVKRLVKDLTRLGWTVTLGKGGHYKAVAPNPNIPVIFIPKTPSEYRSLKNLKSILRRYGVFV